MPTFAATIERVKAARSNPAYQLIAPYLKQQGLPHPDEPLAPENSEYALMCLDDEGWNTILRTAMINSTYKHSTGVAFIDDLERAFEQGADFNELIRQQFKQ